MMIELFVPGRQWILVEQCDRVIKTKSMRHLLYLKMSFLMYRLLEGILGVRLHNLKYYEYNK